MRTRDYVIEYQKVLDDSGTLIKDIDVVDPVSALALEFEGTNGATSNEDNCPSDVITKIEIVDGSEVLYSLSLQQLEALHFYKTGMTPCLFPSEWPGGAQRENCLLLFGRHLWDQEFGMDFTKFKNPQLKITSNIAAIRAAGATGFTSGSLKGTVIAKIMEDAPIPSQYLMAKQIDSFTSAASGDKRIDLPVDYMYRMLMLRAFVEGSDIDEVISDIKLTFDSDKFIAFNRKVKQLDAEALARFGYVHYKEDVYRGHNSDKRVYPNKEPIYNVMMGGEDTLDIIIHRWGWSSVVHFSIGTHAGAWDSTARKLTGTMWGHAPHATLPIPLGDMKVPGTWFDPTVYRKAEAVLTQATVSAVCEIVGEQVRPI